MLSFWNSSFCCIFDEYTWTSLHDEVAALGQNVVEDAMHFIEKNRQAGVVGS